MAALTLAGYRLEAQHAVQVDTTTLAPGTSLNDNLDQIVNEAGRALYSSHSWKFRETVSADIDFVASQSYVASPAGLRQLIAIEANSLTSSIQLTTIDKLLALRAKSLAPAGFAYWAAMIHPRRANATTAPVAPRIELFPTPIASLTAAATAFFRAGWTELTTATDVPDIPLYCETLLRLFVRAVAEGYMNAHADEDGILPVATMEDRIADIMQGPIFKMAVEEDGGEQPDYGPVENGLVQAMCGGGGLDYLDGRSEATPFIT